MARDGFPYTERQQRWWFATHGDNQSSASGWTQQTSGFRSHINNLVARREAEVRQGRIAPAEGEVSFSIEWTNHVRQPWVVREADGRAVRRFDSHDAANTFMHREAARRLRSDVTSVRRRRG